MLSTYKESVIIGIDVAEYSIIHVGIVPSSALYSPTEGNTQDLPSCLMMKHKEVKFSRHLVVFLFPFPPILSPSHSPSSS